MIHDKLLRQNLALHLAAPQHGSADAKNFKLIGQPTGLKVARAKSTGTQAYSMDVQLPGLLTAVIVRPPACARMGQVLVRSLISRINGRPDLDLTTNARRPGARR